MPDSPLSESTVSALEWIGRGIAAVFIALGAAWGYLRKRRRQSAEQQAVAPASSPPRAARKMRVLIADDHRMWRFAITAQLEAAGVDVVGEAGTAAEAAEMALRERPDVVLMDLKMPGGGGVAATREIVREWPEAKVVILTGHDPDEPVRVVEAMKAGAVDYLHKDDALAHLIEKLNEVAGAQRKE